ncbi:hypothetical protein NE237_002527 [Protea cynaroides]|uniref:Uncharacterized protein n=1 Tax=Protea cynaroides TaxID=273540 RepID=A0A9Q0KW90_9MAGN|nr:hypothetical protein NE237_002527 [Protea cynaroides]
MGATSSENALGLEKLINTAVTEAGKDKDRSEGNQTTATSIDTWKDGAKINSSLRNDQNELIVVNDSLQEKTEFGKHLDGDAEDQRRTRERTRREAILKDNPVDAAMEGDHFEMLKRGLKSEKSSPLCSPNKAEIFEDWVNNLTLDQAIEKLKKVYREKRRLTTWLRMFTE